MFVDYIQNGQAHGEVGEQLTQCRYDPGLLRPWRGKNGKTYVTINAGVDEEGKPKRLVRNAKDLKENGYDIPTLNAASLRKDEWKRLDRAVMRAARQRSRAWADLSAANTISGFDGMSKTVYEYETMSDPGDAMIDMDGISEGQADSPLYQLEGIPLPITHASFHFSARQLSTSRNTGSPLDTTTAEACGRRVAETIEKMTIGMTAPSWAYGATSEYGSSAGKIWGYITHPDRLTKTDLTTPDGTNGATTVDEILEMIQQASNAYHYGPFMLYHSTDWDQYMDDDYRSNDSRTLRDRIRAIEAVTDVRRLDFLTNTHTLILVQMTSEVAAAINAMDVTTVMWETRGGMQVNFKVMAIQVPLLRSDYNGNTGIVHGTTA